MIEFFEMHSVTEATEISGKLDNLTVTKTLGSGFSSIVKLAFDPVTATNYALKILNLDDKTQNTSLLLRDEVAAMRCMDHKHIVKYHQFSEEATYIE